MSAFLGRVGYALVVLMFGIPLFPFWLCGMFLEDRAGGYFEMAAIGVLFFAMIFSLPFLLIASGVKWVVTGRGLASLS